jgi:ParB family chromosome partitioning protein
MKGNRVLGRGLSALIQGADAVETTDGDRVSRLPLDAIGFNPRQPRKSFAEDKLEELAASIRQVGVLQPVLVRKLREDESVGHGSSDRSSSAIPRYCVVAGERRLRAARVAGLDEVPALVCTFEETEALKVALLENIQREDLGPIEEATAFQELMNAYGATQDELAAMLGKNRSTIANALRLLTLDDEIQNLLQDGVLSRGHAKALLGLPGGPARVRLARLTVARGLSVREVERRVQRASGPNRRSTRRRRRHLQGGMAEPPGVRELRRRTESLLGTPVAIQQNPRNGAGTIAIKFFDNNDLERLLALIGVQVDLS